MKLLDDIGIPAVSPLLAKVYLFRARFQPIPGAATFRLTRLALRQQEGR